MLFCSVWRTVWSNILVVCKSSLPGTGASALISIDSCTKSCLLANGSPALRPLQNGRRPHCWRAVRWKKVKICTTLSPSKMESDWLLHWAPANQNAVCGCWVSSGAGHWQPQATPVGLFHSYCRPQDLGRNVAAGFGFTYFDSHLIQPIQCSMCISQLNCYCPSK